MIRLYMFLLAMCLLCLFAVVFVYNTTGGNYPFDYGIVIDAGSTHSEVSLYKWLGDEVNGTGVVLELSDCGTHEGIDDNEENVTPTIEALSKCVRTVAQFIDIDLNEITPLYLGATAGMRLLEIKNKPIATFVMESIRDVFSNFETGGKIVHGKDVRIITGEEEGLFAWISVNYLLGVTRPTIFGGHSHKPSVGLLDLGGASSQIAYEVDSNAKSNDTINITLYGHDYHVHSKSNLCFGADEARKRYWVTLIHENPQNTTLEDPCLQKEAQRAIHGSELFDSICLQSVSSSIESLYDRNASYLFTGSADVNKCRQFISRIIDLQECKKSFKYCFEMEEKSPPSNLHFYATSNYYFATSNSFVDLSNVSEAQFLHNTEKWCSRKWSSIVGHVRYPLSFVIDYCFTLNYIYETLKVVYKFDETSFKNIHFKNKVKAQNIGWSLGYMINATNGLPPLEPYPPLIPKSSFIFLMTFLGFLSLTSIALLVWGKRQKRLNMQVT